MSRWLVTGAAGFVGFHVCSHLLERGEEVVGVDSLSDFYSVELKRERLAALGQNGRMRGRFMCYTADVSSPGALGRIVGDEMDYVVHLAAQANVRHSVSSPRDYLQNLAGQLEVLELVRARPSVRALVYASSSSVYGGASSSEPTREEKGHQAPSSFYGATKVAQEAAAQAYQELLPCPVVGLRFFSVYGPWGRPDMLPWVAAEAAIRGLPLELAGNVLRDWTPVSAVAPAVAAAAEFAERRVDPTGHLVFNLGSGSPATSSELVSEICRTAGVQVTVVPKPGNPADVPVTWSDSTLAQALLRFVPERWSDVPALVEWMRWWVGRTV